MAEVRRPISPEQQDAARRLVSWMETEENGMDTSAVDFNSLQQGINEGPLTPEHIRWLRDAFAARYGRAQGRPRAELRGEAPDPELEALLAHTDRVADNAARGGVAAIGAAAYGSPGPHLALAQTLELRLAQRLTMVQTYAPPDRTDYEMIYDGARKLRFTEFGLDVEAAVLSRFDMPELTFFGTPGIMTYGLGFVVEDFYPDLDEGTRGMFMTLIAVHEYGEKIFAGDPHDAHHMATRLELAVAEKMGALDKYLEFLENHSFIKFRDVVLKRLEPFLDMKLKDEGFDVASAEEIEEPEEPLEEDDSMRSARQLAEGFEIAPEITARYEGVDREELAAIEGRLDDWVQYVTTLEQIRSFYARAAFDVNQAVSRAIGRAGPNPRVDELALAIRLNARLAMFKSLGALQHDLDKVLGQHLLEDKLREREAQRFMGDMRAAAFDLLGRGALRAEVESDPLFHMDRKTMEGIARADSAIWENAGWRMRLVENDLPAAVLDEDDGDEDDGEDVAESPAILRRQSLAIETIRRLAWEDASGSSPGRPQTNLEGEADVLRRWGEKAAVYERFGREIEDALQELIDKGPPEGGYLDEGDITTDILHRIYDTLLNAIIGYGGSTGQELLAPAPFVEAQVNAAIPDIWKARSDIPFNFGGPPLVFKMQDFVDRARATDEDDSKTSASARLAYLGGRFSEADEKAQGRIADMVRVLIGSEIGVPGTPRAFVRAAQYHHERGRLPEGLAIRIVTDVIDRGFDENSASDLPFIQVGSLPVQLVMSGMDANEAIMACRLLFVMELNRYAGGESFILRRAIADSDAYWEEARRLHDKEFKGLQNLVAVHRDLMPRALVELVDGRSPDEVWESLGLREYIRRSDIREERAQEAAGEGFGRRFMPFQNWHARIQPLSRYVGSVYGDSSAKLATAVTDRDPKERWQIVRAICRAHMLAQLRAILGHLDASSVINDCRAAQFYTDVIYADFRRRIVKLIAGNSRTNPGEIETQLPDFGLNVKALAGARNRISNEHFTTFLCQLEWLVELATHPGSVQAQKLFEEKLLGIQSAARRLKKTIPEASWTIERIQEARRGRLNHEAQMKIQLGYDRYGTLGTGQRQELASSITEGNSAAEPYENHLEMVVLHYRGLLDLRDDGIGEELGQLLDDSISSANEYVERTGAQSGTLLLSIAWETARLVLIRQMQLGREFRSDDEAIDFLTGLNPKLAEGQGADGLRREMRDDGFAYDRFEDPEESSLVARIGWGYKLARGAGYDELGRLTFQERQNLTASIGEGSRETKDRMHELQAHWETVLTRLVHNPYFGKAQQAAAQVIRDIEAMHNQLGRSWRKECTTLVLWQARRAWAILDLLNGSPFTKKEQIYDRMKVEFPAVGELSQSGFGHAIGGQYPSGDKYVTILNELIAENRKKERGSGNGPAQAGPAPGNPPAPSQPPQGSRSEATSFISPGDAVFAKTGDAYPAWPETSATDATDAMLHAGLFMNPVDTALTAPLNAPAIFSTAASIVYATLF